MPRLDSDVKLDFKDVLVRPKRSTLRSRSEVKRAILLRMVKRSTPKSKLLAVYMQSLTLPNHTCSRGGVYVRPHKP